MEMHVAFQDTLYTLDRKSLLHSAWKMIDTGEVKVSFRASGSGVVLEGPSASSIYTISDSDSALAAVQDIVAQANTAFCDSLAGMVQLTDSSIGAVPVNFSWGLPNFFPSQSQTPWTAPTKDDPRTKGQPFLLFVAQDLTTDDGRINRFYLMWWDFTHTESSDTYITTLPIYDNLNVPRLPGWEDDDGIWGLNTLWKDYEKGAPWVNSPNYPEESDAWGEWLTPDWFSAKLSATPG
jgi:hypothetical protein